MKDQEILQFLHNRMVEVHGENPRLDYMVRFRKIIDRMGVAPCGIHSVDDCWCEDAP